MKKLILLFLLTLLPFSSAFADQKESAYDRVMRTGTLRCGYATYDPVLVKDAITGEVKGIAVDIMEEVGKRLSLNIDWNLEFTYVTGFEELKSNRYDMVCTALWGWASQARVGELIGPIYFYPIGAWVRSDDTRFDDGLSAINNENITISGVDGTFPLDAAREDFPKAKTISLPQSSDYVQPMMDVVTKKADVTFMDNNIGLRFLEKNPGTVKNIAIDPPFKIYGHHFMVNRGEFELRSMIHYTLEQMRIEGVIDRILKKYEAKPGAGYYRLPKPYEVPQ